MNSQFKEKMQQAVKSLPLRIVLGAIVFAIAYGAQYFFKQDEMPAPSGSSAGASFDALYPEQADAALKYKMDQQKK